MVREPQRGQHFAWRSWVVPLQRHYIVQSSSSFDDCKMHRSKGEAGASSCPETAGHPTAIETTKSSIDEQCTRGVYMKEASAMMLPSPEGSGFQQACENRRNAQNVEPSIHD